MTALACPRAFGLGLALALLGLAIAFSPLTARAAGPESYPRALSQAPPPPMASASASDSLGFATGPTGFDLSADERQLFTILLEGAFESDALKVQAFDRASQFMKSLTPGRMLDLSLDLSKKGATTGPIPSSDGIFTRDAKLMQEARRALLKSFLAYFEPGLTDADGRALHALTELMVKISQSSLSGSAKEELLARLTEFQSLAGDTHDRARELMASIDRNRPSNVFDGLRLSATDLAQLREAIAALGIDPLLQQILEDPDLPRRELEKRLGQARSQISKLGRDYATRFDEHVNRIHAAAGQDLQSLGQLREQWQTTLDLLARLAVQPGEHMQKFAELYREMMGLRLEVPGFDLLRNLENLRASLPQPGQSSGLLAELGALHERVSHDGGRAQAFFSELSDLRTLLFRDPAIRGAYRSTVMHALFELVEYDPGNAQDSIADRLEAMQQVVKESKFPRATRDLLSGRIRGLASLANGHSEELREIFARVTRLGGGSEWSASSLLLGWPGVTASQLAESFRARIAAIDRRLPASADTHLRPGLQRLEAMAVELAQAQATSGTLAHAAQLHADLQDSAARLIAAGKKPAEQLLQLDPLAIADPDESIRTEIANRFSAMNEKLGQHDLRARLRGHAVPYFAHLNHIVREETEQVLAVQRRATEARERIWGDPLLHDVIGEAGRAHLDTVMGHDWHRMGRHFGQRAASLTLDPSALPANTKALIVGKLEPFFRQAVGQIETVADRLADSKEIKVWSEDYELFFRILLREYYRRTKFEYKKQMLLGLLKLSSDAGFMEQVNVILQKSGPQLQKLLQIVGREPDLGNGFKAVIQRLEQDVEGVEFDEIHRLMFEQIPHLYPSHFKSIAREKLARGTLAQINKAEFIMPPGVTPHEWERIAWQSHEAQQIMGSIPDPVRGEPWVVAVRNIAPDARERVDDDARVMREIVPVIENEPRLKGTPLERFGNVADGLDQSVRFELDTGRTFAGQTRGEKLYSRRLTTKFNGHRITLVASVPQILNPLSADSGTHVLTFAKGVKLEEFFKFDPQTYRAVAQEWARIWLDEALYGSGFFHMDPHQGNILASRNEDGSIRLTILDFGMHNQLTPEQRAAFIRLENDAQSMNIPKIIHSLNELLLEPMPDAILHKAIANVAHAGPVNASTLIAEAGRLNAKLPNALLDLNRGVWLVGQMLDNAGAPKKMGDILREVAIKKLVAEAPHRVAQSIRGELDGRPETGFPLTNREVGDLAAQKVHETTRDLGAKATRLKEWCALSAVWRALDQLGKR